MNEKYEIKLTDSIRSENLVALGETLGDTLLNSSIENNVIREIPIIGKLAAVYSIGKDIRNYYFLKKTAQFLFGLKDIPTVEREEFIDTLSQKPGKLQEFGETIIMLIEKADNLNKPLIYGNLIKAVIIDDLEYGIAVRICYMVDRTYYSDLEYLIWQFNINEAHPGYIVENLSNVGFVSIKIIDESTLGEHNSNLNLKVDDKRLEMSFFGKALLKYGIQ